MSGLDRFELKNSLLTYVAFRVSALHTFDCLKQAVAALPDEPQKYGFFSPAGLLNQTAPQVQLELLSSTWRKGCSARLYPPSLLDECVLHSVFDCAVDLMLTEPDATKALVVDGPIAVDLAEYIWLPVRMRTLHLTLSLPPAAVLDGPSQGVESVRKQRYKQELPGPNPRDQLFDVLGRWRVNRNLAWSLRNLLTEPEILEITRFLNSNPTHR